MIFTSNFRTAGHLAQAVAISRGLPKGWQGRAYRPLAPSRELIQIAEPVQFIRLYKAQVLDRLDPCQVLRDLGGDNFLMLCWEPPGEFCHRRVVAAWFKKELGLVAPEFNNKLRSHQEWLRTMAEKERYQCR